MAKPTIKINDLFNLTIKIFEDRESFEWRLPHNNFFNILENGPQDEVVSTRIKKSVPTKPSQQWTTCVKNYANQHGLTCSSKKIQLYQNRKSRKISRPEGLPRNSGSNIPIHSTPLFKISRSKLNTVPQHILAFAPPIVHFTLNSAPHPKICSTCQNCYNICSCSIKKCLPCTHLSCPCKNVNNHHLSTEIRNKYQNQAGKIKFLKQVNHWNPKIIPAFLRFLETPSQP